MGNRIIAYALCTALAATGCNDAPKERRPNVGQTMVEPPYRWTPAGGGNADLPACSSVQGKCSSGIECQAAIGQKTRISELMRQATLGELGAKEWNVVEPLPPEGSPERMAAQNQGGPLGGFGSGSIDRRRGLREMLGSPDGKLEAVLQIRWFMEQDISVEPANPEKGPVEITAFFRGTNPSTTGRDYYMIKIKLMPGQDVFLEPIIGKGRDWIEVINLAWAYRATFSAFGDVLNNPYLCE